MPRVVFASDSHLNKHYARMTPDQLVQRRRQIREAWRETIDYALASKADVYIHGGDLFDGPNPRATELTWAAEQFQRLGDAGIRTFLIGGNHDIPKTRLAGSTPQRLFEKVRLATVFVDPTAVTWWTGEIDGLRLAIGGLPPDPRLARDADPFAELREPIRRPEGVDFAMLVTHYAIEGTLNPLAEEATIGKASIAALDGQVDQILVGHVHTARELEIGGVKVLFPGPTERLSFGEMDVKCGFAELSIGGGRPCRATVKQIHLDPQPMRRERVSALDVPAEEPTEWLAERIRAWSAPDQILQLRLEGPLARERYQQLRLRELWQLGNELNFYFDLDRHLLTIEVPEPGDMPITKMGERVSARGEIRRVAEGFLQSAEDEAEQALVAEARDLVLAQYGGGEVADG